MGDEAMALFFYNNKRKDKHMKTKLIGYGIILAAFSNIMEAEPKDGDVQPFKKKKR